ncbi:MAG: YerC/YecD family TrpR-related protein [Alphaproteobacteria bacterium]|nr:YerC/YecD family TrpR-related protein [Alphaproteobacteria bacterium]
MKSLYNALACIKTEKELNLFLKDLCTPGEINALNERWEIAQMLYKGAMSYRDIAQKTGASITTVTRVARFLKDEPNKGYLTVLNRIHHA